MSTHQSRQAVRVGKGTFAELPAQACAGGGSAVNSRRTVCNVFAVVLSYFAVFHFSR